MRLAETNVLYCTSTRFLICGLIFVVASLASTSSSLARMKNFCLRASEGHRCTCVCHREGADILCYTQCSTPKRLSLSRVQAGTSPTHQLVEHLPTTACANTRRCDEPIEAR